MGEPLRCFRCDREAPPLDSEELHGWWIGEPGELVALGEEALAVLVCPECREEERADEDLGGGD